MCGVIQSDLIQLLKYMLEIQSQLQSLLTVFACFGWLDLLFQPVGKFYAKRHSLILFPDIVCMINLFVHLAKYRFAHVQMTLGE